MYRIAVCEDEANVREQLCSCCDDILLKPISKAELSDAIAADIRINHSSDSVVMYSGMKAVIQRVG